jgi:hypothetical protein
LGRSFHTGFSTSVENREKLCSSKSSKIKLPRIRVLLRPDSDLGADDTAADRRKQGKIEIFRDTVSRLTAPGTP